MLTYLYNLKSIFLDQVNFFRKKSSSFSKKIVINWKEVIELKSHFNRTFVSRIIFCSSIIFFIIIQIFIFKFKESLKKNSEIKQEIFPQVNLLKKQQLIDEEIKQVEEWKIKIPCIELVANIKEGTDKTTLNKYIGHFSETKIQDGNIGLAAHNRGYEVNYFARLKELKEGDEIIYKYDNIEKIYEVFKNKIIKDTDIQVLKNTDENILTLITCVENEPEYRRCVQAKEKDMNYNY